MPITGTFEADFSKFVAAVESAEVKLKSFESGSARVERTLSRMTDSFSGRRIIQDATLMSEVFARAGGAANFTTTELQRMNATGAEAVAKLRALGQEVPRGLQNMVDQTRQATTAFGGLRGVVTDVAAGIAALFTLRAGAQFVTGVASAAKELRNLSREVDVSTDDLQAFGAVTGDLGVDMNELGTTIGALVKRIAGGDASAVGGLHQLGLTVERVRGLKPAELFQTILRSIDALPDHLSKVNAATDLFGGKVGTAVVKVAGGFDEAVESARRLNTTMSEDTVRAAAAAADAIDQLQKNLFNLGANAIGPLAEGFNALYSANQRGVSVWQLLTAAVKDFATSNSVTGPNVSNLAKLLDEVNTKTAEVARTSTAAAEAPGPVSQEQILRAILADEAVGTLTASQEHYLRVLEEQNLLTQKNAEAFGVSAAQLGAFKAQLEQTAAVTATTTKLWNEYHALVAEGSNTTTAVQIANINKWADEQVAAAKKANADTAAFYDALAALTAEKLSQVGSNFEQLAARSTTALREQADAAEADYHRMIASGLGFSRQVLEEQLEKVRRLRAEANGLGDDYVSAFDRAADAADRAARAADKVSKPESYTTSFNSLEEVEAAQNLDPIIRENLRRYFQRQAGGGSATTPAAPRTPSATTPSAAGPTTIQNTFNVNGTAADVARQIEQQIVKSARLRGSIGGGLR